MTEGRLILYVHGSKDPRWRAPFQALERRVQEDLGEASVRLAYMEFAEPTLQQVVAESAGSGHRRLRLLPLFLAAGAHLANDLPEQVGEVRDANPGVEIEVLPPIGEHPRFVELIEELVKETIRTEETR